MIYRHGFALIAVLSLMILLGIIAVGFLTLSSVTLRTSTQSQAVAVAQANARLALQLAIAELQKAAGPDQRVTATADILPIQPKPNDPNDPEKGKAKDGCARWTGVWNTSTYSAKTPDTKAFVRWLVSGQISPDAERTEAEKATDVLLFQGKDAASSVKVPKVSVTTSAGSPGSYAYWVEDEGVKADLGWSESTHTNALQKQSARLQAAPGPDHASFAGPFTNKTTYPVTTAAGNAWLSNLPKATSAADMPLVMSDTAPQHVWLRDNRHDMTLGSRGVLADVKQGGLRRDLSLAFEMDGTADVSATSQPTRFNQQVGEFVGGTDRLAAPKAALGMNNVVERFLYRDTNGSGTPFSSDIQAGHVVRGPNWWALRDYATLYKRIKGNGGTYSIDSRSYYPNASAARTVTTNEEQIRRYNWGEMTTTSSGATTLSTETVPLNWSTTGLIDRYLFKPARASYAPIFLGSVVLYSVLATNSNGTEADLALGVDPFFYLWNPYNRTLNVPRYALKLTGFGGHVTLWVKRGSVTTRHGPAIITNYAKYNSGISEGEYIDRIHYLASDLTMKPGEVMVLSPKFPRASNATMLRDAIYPGTNTNTGSGAIFTRLPDSTSGNGEANWKPVRLNLATDRVSFAYSHAGSTSVDQSKTGWQVGHFYTDTALPPPTITPADLKDSKNYGDYLQQIGNNLHGNLHLPEYFDPARQWSIDLNIPPIREEAAIGLVGTKVFFGIQSYLTKPAANQGDGFQNPMEVFTQFNPFPMGGYHDMYRPCLLSQSFNAIADPRDANQLLNRAGISFPATQLERGFWGANYSSGSTSVPMINIPSTPILSLAAFADANLSCGGMQPFRAVGNSWSSLLVSPTSPYGRLTHDDSSNYSATASDTSWLINDALFDRYWLSGIAPAFTINGSYAATSTVTDTLTKFYGSDFASAQANPVLRPYLPPGKAATTVVTELAADTGYRRLGAYSLVDGAFNVNSTSVPAWTAFLRGNRNLAVSYAQGAGSNNMAGVPFPKNGEPGFSSDAQTHWSGFARLTDTQLTSLATEIVKQVKLRGPFMSLSDFVNHRVGTPENLSTRNETHYMGALQAAIELSNINSAVQTGGGGTSPVYTGAVSRYFPDPPPISTRKSTTGIAGDITQADLLLPLAPRLSARSDTFRIRTYGEALDADGKVVAKAYCEAVVQRFPEYMDPQTDSTNNEPWDEASTTSPTLNATNAKYGRRFQVVGFRWLDASEI
jgi:type II secretory pathway pseudopilin PulG